MRVRRVRERRDLLGRQVAPAALCGQVPGTRTHPRLPYPLCPQSSGEAADADGRPSPSNGWVTHLARLCHFPAQGRPTEAVLQQLLAQASTGRKGGERETVRENDSSGPREEAAPKVSR